jgi:pimeloyl-ACP methyl ester carboxylesterase
LIFPLDFIRGSESDYITANDEAAIQQQFSQSQVISIPDAGHWVHAAAPEEFLHVVNAFLDN